MQTPVPKQVAHKLDPFAKTSSAAMAGWNTPIPSQLAHLPVPSQVEHLPCLIRATHRIETEIKTGAAAFNAAALLTRLHVRAAHWPLALFAFNHRISIRFG
jgi:hypothetical protein